MAFRAPLHRFHIVIGEAGLHRTVSDSAVMAAQLVHLFSDLDRPNLRLGVIPLYCCHDADGAC
ncbi:Scr1 family TA system antitoxin-like transcriptional regulator [Nocardia sp. NPDC051756]|uniref:Scr1 family TA system antitoxin-like transcriptional regulator n=1 Tax=Nocardia sp. NPDC051756 TaxID=3154751 RepID=UPI003414428F